jgi:multidrug efflux pump subunit AcrA (membrane-fusion protein)
MAETGFRELYKLVAWMVSKFQNTTAEFAVLGKEMTVDPRKWRGNHSIVSKVGLGAGDPSQTITNMASLLTIDQQLQAVPGGAMLIDPKKTYNKLAKIIKSMGQTDIADFYNDPDKPEEMLLAQNTQLMQALEQAQALLQQQQNPIAEAEQVRAQASLIEAQAKQQMDLAKLAQNQDQFLQKLREEARQFNQKTATERTKMELDSGKDVPGSTV